MEGANRPRSAYQARLHPATVHPVRFFQVRVPWILLILSALASAFPVRAHDEYAAWTYSRRIGFNTMAAGAAVPGPVTDFPLCVKLSAPEFDFSRAKVDGSDIRFSDADSTPLPYQIERWNRTLGKAEIWVKVPKVEGGSSDDYITMCWGKADAVSESDGAKVFPAAGGFSAVWHLSEGGAGSRLNSVSAQNPATPHNYDGDESRPGVLGLSDSLNGGATNGDYLELGSGFADFTAGFTYSVWAYPAGIYSFERFLQLGNGEAMDNIHLGRKSETQDAYFEFTTADKAFVSHLVPNAIDQNRWQHLAVSIKGTFIRIFKNGVPIQTAIASKGPNIVVRTRNYIGRSNWAKDGYFKGKIDEPQISVAERSPDWIKLAYETQKQDSRFFILGPVNSVVLTITAQPASLGVLEGAAATFAVAAVSTRPLIYQWQKDGLPIADAAKSTFTIPSTKASDAGAYNCKVYDGVNAIASDTAFLTVFENPALWTQSMKIGINTSPQGADIPGDLLDFPLLVRFDSTWFDFSRARTDGADLRFTDAAGLALSYQVVRWNPGIKVGEAWVKVPKIKGGTDANSITLLWGRADAVSRSGGATVFPKAGGWRGVWHMDDKTGESVADATGNGYTGIGTKVVTGSEGLAGEAIQFGGADNRVALPGEVTGGLKAFTFSLWAKESATPVSASALKSPTLLGLETAGAASDDIWIFSFNGKLGFGHGLIPRQASIDSVNVSHIPINDKEWHFISLTYDGARVVLYEAGRPLLSSPAIGTALAAGGYDIGNFHWRDDSRTNGFQGIIDEVQITSVALGDDWVKLAYETQRMGGKAIDYGTVADLPVPVPTVFPPAGVHSAPLSVSLFAVAGAEIRYTLDGTSPLVPATSGKYAGAFTLTRSATLRAVALKDGKYSEVLSADYLLTRSLAPGDKDTLAPGDTLALGGGTYLVHPGLAGTLPVTIESQGIPGAVGGFEMTGPMLGIGFSGPAGTFPGLAMKGVEGPQDGIAIFRIGSDGYIWRVDPKDGGLWIPQAGDYFRGRDTSAPRIDWLGSRQAGNDSLETSFRVTDNVRNFLWRLHYQADRADSTAWLDGLSGDSLAWSLKVSGAVDPMEIRLKATDGSSTAYFPEGEDRVFTLSRPLPKATPIVLEAGIRWTLAGLPCEGEKPLTVESLAEANGGGRFYAALWQDNPADPGTGAYRILKAGEGLPSGQALWLAADDKTPALVLSSRRSVASDSDGFFPIPLVPGWNLVANPSLRSLVWPVSRKDLDAYTRSKVKVAHGFDGSGYSPVDTLRPWKGYYVFNHGADTVIRLEGAGRSAGIAKRASTALAQSVPAVSTPLVKAGSGRSLSLQLEDSAGGMVLLGARTWASEGIGPEDDPAPPQRQGRREGLWLSRARRALSSDFVRWEDGQAFRWTVVSRRTGPGPRRLTFSSGVLPDGAQVWAAFPSRKVKLRLDEAVSLPLGAEDTVELYAGSPEALAAVPGLADLAFIPGGFLQGYRHGARGWELVLALPSAARVRLRLVRLDGVQLGSWDRQVGPGWHVWPLSGNGGRWASDRGVRFSELQVNGEGWSARRTEKIMGMGPASTSGRSRRP